MVRTSITRHSFLGSALVLCVAAHGVAQEAPAAAPMTRASLDAAVFKTQIQPIFLAKRDGLQACATCHSGKVGTAFRLVPLPEGATTWSDEDTKKNMTSVASLVRPGDPGSSRLLTHPLDRSAGGDPFHGGGKHWRSQTDAEWRTLASWVRGVSAAPVPAARGTAVRIIQTNAAGDGAHLIDPGTNTVVAVLHGVDIPHGVTSSPDGARLYLTNEHRETLDVVDAETLTVDTRIRLSGRPNNVSITRDGRKI